MVNTGKSVDLTGQRFGRLVVVCQDGYFEYPNSYSKKRWKCICDCGNIIYTTSSALKTGNTSSCGCLRREYVINKNTTHNSSKTRLYTIWEHIKARCLNQNCTNYKYYGGRGITICEEWINNYIAFEKWSIANGYSDNLTIDRIDVDGDYCPQNCRWITAYEQNRNMRKCINITYNGETHILSEWAEILNISYGVLRDRLVRYNWSIEDAFTIPVSKKKIRYNKRKENDKNGSSTQGFTSTK